MMNAFQSRAFRREKGVGWNGSLRSRAQRARPREVGGGVDVTGNLKKNKIGRELQINGLCLYNYYCIFRILNQNMYVFFRLYPLY